jgi:hypothetical protein
MIYRSRPLAETATAQAGCSGRLLHALRQSSTRDRIRPGVDECVVRGVHGWKTRRVFDRDNITAKKDMESVLPRLEQYRHDQLQLQDKLREFLSYKLQCVLQQSCRPYGA